MSYWSRISSTAHCRRMRFCARCVLQWGVFLSQWAWLRSSLHQGKTSTGYIYIYSRLYLCVRSGNTSSSRQKVLHLTQCWCTWIPLLFSTEKNDVSFFWLVLVTLKPLWKTVAPEQIPIAHSLIKMSICAIFQFWSAVIREKHLLVEYKKRLAFHFFFQSFAK